MTDKPVVGRFIPEKIAEALHGYLMTKPAEETFELIVALRQSKPLTREPK